jgi:hypothetical protein
MDKFARGGWTDQQILDALLAFDGARGILFRADVLRNGTRVREAALAPGGSVTLDKTASIMRTARIELYEPLNWLKDEIKPYMLLRMEDAIVASSVSIVDWDRIDALELSWDQWDAKDLTWDQLDQSTIGGTTRAPRFAEFPLGVFVPSTPKRSSFDGVNTWSVEAYDRTVILNEDGLDTPLYVAAGMPYLDAVQDVLLGVGISNVMVVDYVATALPADREFEIGITKLAVINTLLTEINFNPIFCDAEGRFVISAYKAPSPARLDFTYAADALSIIASDTQSETDYYGMPNVFIAVCSNPDMDAEYRSVYVNDNPVSQLSTIQRGRRIISEIYRPEQIASQEDLDAYIARVAFERAQQASETVIFNTALMPVHGRGDVIGLKHPDISGTFEETRWVLPFDADGLMEHEARRVVLL